MSSDRTEQASSYPGGFDYILDRMEGRRDPFIYGPGESLPPADINFAPMRKNILDGEAPEVDGSSSSFAHKVRSLKSEFRGEPELCYLNGLLIAHLRKRAQPPHTAALFQRLWAEESAFLVRHLDARWLVSSITTFADHGVNGFQRQVGASMNVLFAMMKLYETERLFSGKTPDTAHRLADRIKTALPLEMDAYSVPTGGLDINMLGRIWQEAGRDPVIAPLARHLLNALIEDERTVFRRFHVMRNKLKRMKKKQAAPNRNTVPIPADLVETDGGKLRWGVVSTVKAPLRHIAQFAAWHLTLGADRLYLFLDDPDKESHDFFARHPRIKVASCDEAYWDAQSKERMETHPRRQVYNATQTFRGSSDLHWLAHIDVDEFLLAERPIRDVLAGIPADAAWISLPVAEMLAGGPDTGTKHFKLTARMGGQEKSVLQDIYPTYGAHLRGGFVGHLEGKAIARCGLEGVRLGVHALMREGNPVANKTRLTDTLIGHAHVRDLDFFTKLLDFRIENGSYGTRGDTDFGLIEIIDYLRETEGESGLKHFYQEVCADTPELVEALAEHNMLLRHDMDLDDLVRQVFGTLPPNGDG